MAGCFTSRDANGFILNHYFRLATNGLAPDNQELLAQGREAENSRIKRDYNRLPCFDTIVDAKRAFEQGRIPGLYGDWCSWRYGVDRDMDNFRQDYRVKQGLAA
jgi:hypothetical protein